MSWAKSHNQKAQPEPLAATQSAIVERTKDRHGEIGFPQPETMGQGAWSGTAKAALAQLDESVKTFDLWVSHGNGTVTATDEGVRLLGQMALRWGVWRDIDEEPERWFKRLKAAMRDHWAQHESGVSNPTPVKSTVDMADVVLEVATRTGKDVVTVANAAQALTPKGDDEESGFFRARAVKFLVERLTGNKPFTINAPNKSVELKNVEILLDGVPIQAMDGAMAFSVDPEPGEGHDGND